MVRTKKPEMTRSEADALANGIIRQLNSQRIGIGLGVRHHSLDPDIVAGTHDSYGNFTTVGDQDLFYHLEIPKPLEQTTLGCNRKTGRRVTKCFKPVAQSTLDLPSDKPKSIIIGSLISKSL